MSQQPSVLQQLERKPDEVPTRESALALMARGYAEGEMATSGEQTSEGSSSGGAATPGR
jgi:hypothetical protein